jgi:hypothetical protein
VSTELFLNGFYIEVTLSEDEDWQKDAIYIYDCLSSMREEERDSLIEYLYSEGFVQDRKTRCEVIRGEDCL